MHCCSCIVRRSYLNMDSKQFAKLKRMDESIKLTTEQDCVVYTTELLEMEEEPEQLIAAERDTWGKGVEFLFSCIALSVGLGNVWRFPFIALENGGGAFLIPYLVVLLLVGRPIYYLEVIIGQFSSRGCIGAFDLAPIFKGVAYGQVYSTALATTYYACIMALTIRYLVVSFSEVLPWTYCLAEWGAQCVATGATGINSIIALRRAPLPSCCEDFFTARQLDFELVSSRCSSQLVVAALLIASRSEIHLKV